MIGVKNRRQIARLSRKTLRANRSRNIVAALAIALTTVLFTALFTIALSLNAAFQDANFRQAGGWNHATFKSLTRQQFEELKGDQAVRQWGLRRFVGMARGEGLEKAHVEVGYSDANQAHFMFCDPVEGRLPREGTNEAATDKRVLELLGVEPVIGARFTLPIDVDGKTIQKEFTLCGWWEYDEAVVANHVLLPESRAEEVFQELSIQPPGQDGMSGAWTLDVMFRTSWNIEGQARDMLARHGYQSETRNETFVAIGVNWGYSASQLVSALDPFTVLAVAVLLLVIVFTGYLIIYNVFQISVVSDIRFYGLLKTIGTTPRQLRRIIRHQAWILSLFSIPVGLILGWLVGCRLVPTVADQLNGMTRGVVSASPLIFVLSALFSLMTVAISCRRPGRLAARVSPIEAVRYTEGKGKKSRGRRGVSLPAMALKNLGRSRGKSAVTVLSLALAVVLLTITATFTTGFDMNKYLSAQTACDFVLADAGYFQSSGWNGVDNALPQEVIDEVLSQPGVQGGAIYTPVARARESVSEEYFRQMWSQWYDEASLNQLVDARPRDAQGRLQNGIDLYGMGAWALEKLTAVEGDLSALGQPDSRSIAAVLDTDDYGVPIMDSNWARLGDTVSIEYIEEWEYFDRQTGQTLDPDALPPDGYDVRPSRSHTEEYTVAALVTVPQGISFRRFSGDAFVLGEQALRDHVGGAPSYLAFDMKDEAARAQMQDFLQELTLRRHPDLDYESRDKVAAEFEDFRSMFLLMGGALSLLVGLVGVLNFVNAILTGILTRQKELAMLQSIGMTGRQLRRMLMLEGLYYTLGALLFSLTLTLATAPLLSRMIERIFWFFTYRLTLWPILILAPIFALLGALVPQLCCRLMVRRSLVERLRQET